MPMNIVIQEQRKLLGLTQEQVADYLGVSTPAVSKWEKGITSPDIGLQILYQLFVMYQFYLHIVF